MTGIRRKLRKRARVAVIACLAGTLAWGFSACKSSGTSGSSIFSTDETADAAKIVLDANAELNKIKVLYKENEGKREELKNAMKANDADKAKKIAKEVVDLIDEGSQYARTAVEKLQKAQEMQINDYYRNYLSRKEGALKRQLQAFSEYKDAAQTLQNNYDPKNTATKNQVQDDFKARSETYKKLMDDARSMSDEANEIAKDALKKQLGQ